MLFMDIKTLPTTIHHHHLIAQNNTFKPHSSTIRTGQKHTGLIVGEESSPLLQREKRGQREGGEGLTGGVGYVEEGGEYGMNYDVEGILMGRKKLKKFEDIVFSSLNLP